MAQGDLNIKGSPTLQLKMLDANNNSFTENIGDLSYNPLDASEASVGGGRNIRLARGISGINGLMTGTLVSNEITFRYEVDLY